MRYTLIKDNQVFETESWVMADRKYASGWKFSAPEKTLQEAAEELKNEFQDKVDALYDKPIAGAATPKKRGRPKAS